MRSEQGTTEARRTRRRPEQGFRKGRCSRFHSHLLAVQPDPGSPQTRFEGPFGEVLRATGLMAKANPFRFSTKYHDDETDLLYYGYRYYNASAGKWLGRDPQEESGGLNLYNVLDNDPLLANDLLGLCSTFCTCTKLRVTLYPPTKKFDPGFYPLGDQLRFGALIIVDWILEEGSDPTLCSYFAKEPPGGVTIIYPGGKSVSDGTSGGDWQRVPNPWYDATGIYLHGPGTYIGIYRLTQSYKCVNSDGSDITTTPTHFNKTVKKHFPEDQR